MSKDRNNPSYSFGNVSGNVAIGSNHRQTAITQSERSAAQPASQPIKILCLAANPQGTSQLRLDEEARLIQARIRSAEMRDSMEFVTRWATRPDDLQQELLEQKPQIVHFSGHGSRADGIVLVDDRGAPKPVSAAALRHLFSILKDDTRLVVLNACNSQPLAEAITEHIDCAIGMGTEIGDEAAIVFAGALYRAIGFGKSIEEAFQLATNALMLEGIREEQTPVLLSCHDVDPARQKLLGATE